MFKVEVKYNDVGQYVAEVSNSEGEIFYSTYKYHTDYQATEDARQWIDWSSRISSGNVESIYYILSVPENWTGPPKGTHVYSGLNVKIGRTKDVLRRVKNLRTGTPGKLIIHALEPGGVEIEQIRHKQFKSDRRQGEWFACSPKLHYHILSTWNHYRILPPAHQNFILELVGRIQILCATRKVFDGVPDMINPSLNEPWAGKVFLDLTQSNLGQ